MVQAPTGTGVVEKPARANDFGWEQVNLKPRALLETYTHE